MLSETIKTELRREILKLKTRIQAYEAALNESEGEIDPITVEGPYKTLREGILDVLGKELLQSSAIQKRLKERGVRYIGGKTPLSDRVNAELFQLRKKKAVTRDSLSRYKRV